MQPKKVDLVGTKTGPDSTDKMMTTTDNPARIAGRPVTETFTTLPVDRGEGQGTAGNKIADGGWEATVQGGAMSHVPDDSDFAGDADLQPLGNLIPGDGLTMQEEYRGFSVQDNDHHIRTHPYYKDLFVLSGLGLGFSTNLILPLHLVEASDVALDTYEINPNRSGIDGSQHQCYLRIYVQIGPAEGFGRTLPREGYVVSNVPCAIDRTFIFSQAIYDALINQCEYYINDTKMSTIAHEIGHSVDIDEYIYDGDRYTIMVTEEPISKICESGPSEVYDSDDRNQLRIRPCNTPEGGCL